MVGFLSIILSVLVGIAAVFLVCSIIEIVFFVFDVGIPEWVATLTVTLIVALLIIVIVYK